MTYPFWFGGPSDIDPLDRAYPLRALREEAGSRTTAISDDEFAVITRIRAGDAETFEQLYRAHADGLIGFAYRLCGVRATAQDIVADLFVHLWEHRADWQPRSGLRAYLFTAVRHRLSNQLRGERRADSRAARAAADPSLTSGPRSAEVQLEQDDELAAVWRVIDTFPPLRRQVMYLRWARGLTPDEIAAVVGLTRSGVDKHLSRAIHAIRAAAPQLINDR